MRKLASIQKILAIETHPNADSLEIATVLGWKVCVKKGEFQVGDLVVYGEVDSIWPERPEFEFLRPRGFRIKTIRLRSAVSQGICFPLSILPRYSFGVDGDAEHAHLSTTGEFVFPEGYDVTEILGVTKYDPPIPTCLSGQVKGNFPSWLIESDETRIQTVLEVLKRYRGQVFEAREKLDGSSTTFYIKDEQFGVCSRNLDLIDSPSSSQWQLWHRDRVAWKMGNIATALGIKNIAIQGELIGPGIQGNHYGLKQHEFYVFNIFDIDGHRFYDPEILAQMTAEQGLKVVPLVDRIELNHTVDDLVKFATGKSLLKSDVWREGLVFRPLREQRDPDLGRLSFKVINPEYLLKYD